LISVYDNPTNKNADSMASMFLALDDPEFAPPTTADLIARATVVTDGSAVILRTSEGDIGAMLLNNQAPATALEVARLMTAGAFQGAEAKVTDSSITFTSPLTDELRRLVQYLPGDLKVQQVPGTMSFCATAENISLMIATSSTANLDGHCTVFAQVGPGGEVLRAITASGSAQLLRGEILSGPELNDLHLAPARKIAAR